MATKNQLHILLLFLGSWHTLVCLLGLGAGALYVTTHIYGPTLEFSPKKRRKILADCPVTTNDRQELVVDGSITEEEAFNIVDTHGVAIIPSVLSKTTAQKFRDYVQKANHEMRQVYVHKKENRFRIMPTPFEEPLAQEVMTEIAQHDALKPLLDNIMGPSASLISFSIITSTYGAESQDWHRDTSKSPMTHPEDFVHEFTLTIPLQDTTAEMGATGICPGTHRCMWVEGYETDDQDLPCNITASLSQGDALLYHTDAIHKGGAHIDPDAPERSVLFVSFAESRQSRADMVKRLAYGKVYSSPWRMWGVTIDDFPHMGSFQWKWSYLHPLGLRLFRGDLGEGVRPWSAVDAFLHIFNLSGNTCYFLSNSFDAKAAKGIVGWLLYWILGIVALYAWIGIPLWVYAALEYFRLNSSTTKPQTKTKPQPTAESLPTTDSGK